MSILLLVHTALASQAMYYNPAAMSPIFSPSATTGPPLYSSSGNVNGSYTDESIADGYLDGYVLSMFHWSDRSSDDCASGVSECASILTTSEHHDDLPYWGSSDTEHQYALAAYRAMTDASNDYFDVHNTIGTDIADVSIEHELVVLVIEGYEAGGDSPCKYSCMRPNEDSGASSDFKLMAATRPDGRSGSVDYTERPKLLLNPAYLSPSVRVPVHEFGHYYNRVVVPQYGSGGGFPYDGDRAFEEIALDEGLSYWYVSDWANTRYEGRSLTDVRYTQHVEGTPEEDSHHLGEVLTAALWEVRAINDCDNTLWTQSVFALVDSIPGDAFGHYDPFGDESILRGFAWRLIQQAEEDGVCSGSALSEAVDVFVEHELLSTMLTQEDTGATSEAGDEYGRALATGDFNQDGFDDLVIGSPGEDNTYDDSGLVHIAYGDVGGLWSGGVHDVLRVNQTSFSGSSLEEGDRFGHVLAVGDFDGDGYDDLAVGSPYEDYNATVDAGYLMIFYGGASGLSSAGGEKLWQSTVGSTIEAGDRFAASLVSGDFNGDGYDDLGVGSPGEDLSGNADSGHVTVLFGGGAGLLPVDTQPFWQETLGGNSDVGDQFGYALAAGDLDGNGCDDLIISSPRESVSGADDAGQIWAVYGDLSGLDASTAESLSQADVSGTGPESDDRFGYALAVGDLDDDGYADVVVGSPYEDWGSRQNAGHVGVLYGASGGLGGTSAGWPAATGAQEYTYYGFSFAVGDIDDDGLDDLAVGYPYARDVAVYAGLVELFLSSDGDITLSAAAFAATSDDCDNLGAALTLGDYDGAGGVELGLSAPGRTIDGASSAGAVYVYSH